MKSHWSLGVTGYSPGTLRGRRPRRGMAVPGGGLELTVTTTPAEVLSMVVNMAQNGWSLEECLQMLGLAGPGGFAEKLIVLGSLEMDSGDGRPAR